MIRIPVIATAVLALLASCGGETEEPGPAKLAYLGAAIDSAPLKGAGITRRRAETRNDGEYRKLGFPDLSLEELGEEGVEDLLDALLYPEELFEEELAFPEHVQSLDQTKVALRGYMIPSVQKDGVVTEFILVADLLSCCFGGAPQPDQWVDVKMVDGNISEYFAFVPIRVKGKFWLQVIEDEAGYASGCFHIDGVEVEREP